MKKAQAVLRVRYGETDKMGGVYYANYIAWFEIGRSTLLMEAGYPYKALEEDGYILPVVETYCKYRSPAYYDDRLIIETWITGLTKRDITFRYHIERDGKLIAEGFTRHMPINPEGKRIYLPSYLLSLLLPYIDNANMASPKIDQFMGSPKSHKLFGV